VSMSLRAETSRLLVATWAGTLQH